VAVLVAFQFLAHDGMEDAWESAERAGMPALDSTILAYMHIGAGILILLLMFFRAYLRLTRGVPAPPADEHWTLQFMAEAVHVSIYILLLLLPISGALAWFLGIEPAADVHEFLTNLLLLAIFLHVAGALFQHFVMRSNVVIRIFRPQRS
jgi:cytochrome b561